MENQIQSIIAQMDEDTQKNKYLIFTIDKEEYGIEIRYVTEIIGIQKITSVPDIEEYIKGVINLRGKIIPVVDVKMRFKKENTEYDDRTCIIVVEVESLVVGLIVNRVLEVIDIKEDEIIPPPEFNRTIENKYIKGIGKVGEEVKLLLDCKVLLGETSIEASEEGEESVNILFCHIGWMKYYKGISEKDECINGNAYVDIEFENAEQYNFLQRESFCFGYVAARTPKEKRNEIAIERIDKKWEHEDKAEGILIIWVANEPSSKHGIKILGWYQNATVYKQYQEEFGTVYNIKADAENCVLLPLSQRKFHILLGSEVEKREANIWYEEQIRGENLKRNIINYISGYKGERLNLVIKPKTLMNMADEVFSTKKQYVEKAEQLYEEKKEIEALKYYNKVLQLEGNSPEVLNQKGLILYHLCQYRAALKAYEAALKLNENFTEVHYNKGLIYYELGELEYALQCFNEFLNKVPEDKDALLYKALTLKGLNRVKDAMEVIDKAIQCYPEDETLKSVRSEFLE